MLRPVNPALRARHRTRSLFGTSSFTTMAAAIAMACAGPLAAQDLTPEELEKNDTGTPANPGVLPDAALPAVDPQQDGVQLPRLPDGSEPREIAFEADILGYEASTEIVTATGNVLLRSEDQSLRADKVTWNRTTGQILATGRVRMVDENGNQLFTDSLELTDEFEAGAMENLLLALRQGGRLAAREGMRSENGEVTLSEAAYSGCAVETPQGCPKEPSWRITADRVTYTPADDKVRFTGAYLDNASFKDAQLQAVVGLEDPRARRIQLI